MTDDSRGASAPFTGYTKCLATDFGLEPIPRLLEWIAIGVCYVCDPIAEFGVALRIGCVDTEDVEIRETALGETKDGGSEEELHGLDWISKIVLQDLGT
jgi:hypothetical protein